MLKNVQLADFGFSRAVDSSVTMTRCGSPLWIAPEIVRGEKFNESSDVFSFSIVMWELMAWQEPYPGEDPTVVMAKVAQFNYRPTRDRNWPQAINRLMKVGRFTFTHLQISFLITKFCRPIHIRDTLTNNSFVGERGRIDQASHK